jgi:hypothetical protein
VTLPNLIVIGAMKAGTSSLYEYLRAHPQVFMSDPKELRFFVAGDGNWDRGLDWYERHFDDAGDARVRGEASPRYARAPLFAGVPERMASVVPDARLVYLVRHPVERMRSHYQQLVYDGWETRPAERALREYADYLDTSRYAFQLERYLEHFDASQVLVITTEDLRDARAAALSRLAAFLEIDDVWPAEAVAAVHHETVDKELPRPWRNAVRRLPGYGLAARVAPHRLRVAFHRASVEERGAGAGAAAAAVSPELVAELTDRLRPDVARLRELVGDAVGGWGIA